MVIKEYNRFKVFDESFNEDALEMIGEHRVKELNLARKEKKLDKLKRIIKKQEAKLKMMKPPKIIVREVETTEPELIEPDYLLAGYEDVYTNVIKENKIVKRAESPDFFYDYDKLLQEYIGEADQQVHNNDTFNATYEAESLQQNETVKDIAKAIIDIKLESRNCTDEEARHIGLKAIKCFATDVKSGQEKPSVLLKRFWTICKIWLAVYIVIAVPLFCTRGWCCPCLFCKFFKPRQRIELAKRFMLHNPPGVFKQPKREIKYTPTEYEIDSYEELDLYVREL